MRRGVTLGLTLASTVVVVPFLTFLLEGFLARFGADVGATEVFVIILVVVPMLYFGWRRLLSHPVFR
ncbi:hypothetical protein GCM10022275_07190 [Tessaracoccus defluvii]